MLSLKDIYYCIICKVNKISIPNMRYGKKRCQSCAKKQDMLGAGNNRYKGGLPLCVDCNKQLSNYHYKRCKKCANHLDKHPNWMGGISRLPYSFDFDDSLKEKIRQRDNYECQNCGMTEEEHLMLYGTSLNIHHINYDKQNCHEQNLITTCKQCNSRANFDRLYWQDYYENIIKVVVSRKG